MHSPNEVVALEDIDATIKLLAAFCRGLGSGDEFIPR
jgi:putative aminopeptidase FrvX